MMVALLLYAYARGMRSSRGIERACEEDVAFRVIAAHQRPDHATIARFRRAPPGRAGRAVRRGAGAVRAGRAGRRSGWSRSTARKVHANAVASANLDYEQLAREILEEADAVDAAEDELYGDRARRRAAAGARDRAGPPRVVARGQAAPGGRSAPRRPQPVAAHRARSGSGRPSAAWRRSSGPSARQRGL